MGSQDLGDDNSKIDPKEVRKQCRVINAESRRDEWIRHQQQKLDDEDHDQVFRKGIDRGKSALLYSYRGHYQRTPGNKTKPLKNLSMPRATDRFRDKVNATADGATKIDISFKKQISNIQRYSNNLTVIQKDNFKFTDSRNEMNRAQTQINKLRANQGSFNMELMVNPKWRNVQKTQWMNSK